MKAKRNMEFDASEHSWYEKKIKNSAAGLRVADTLDEVKNFAYECFDKLDKNGDGFITVAELTDAMSDDRWDWRQKSFICFMIRRIEDISEAYEEEWDCKDSDGISRADIQEYFKVIRKRISG